MSTYSFIDTSCSLTGPTGILDLGYGAGVAEEGISFEPSDDINTMLIGADGQGQHSLHANKSGIVTLRYLKVSPVNARLMAMYIAQTSSSALHGQNVIVARHSASGDVHTGLQCAFKRKPNFTYAKDGDIIEWQFDAIQIVSVLGRYPQA